MINPATTWLRCPEQRSFTPWEASFEFKRQEAEMVPSKAPSPMCTLSETANLPLTTCRALPRHPWAGRKCPKGNKPECGEGRTAAVLRPRLSSVSSGRFLDNLRRRAHRTMRWSGQKKRKNGRRQRRHAAHCGAYWVTPECQLLSLGMYGYKLLALQLFCFTNVV